MACRHCGAATPTPSTRVSAASRLSAKHHGEEAAEDLKEGDIVGAVRHLVTPLVGPAVGKVLATVCWRCGKRP